LRVSDVLEMRIAREAFVELAHGKPPLSDSERDDLSELWLRLVHSFFDEPGLRRRDRRRCGDCSAAGFCRDPH
jgi:hypothetical protein